MYVLFFFYPAQPCAWPMRDILTQFAFIERPGRLLKHEFRMLAARTQPPHRSDYPIPNPADRAEHHTDRA